MSDRPADAAVDGFTKHGITHLSPSSLNLWVNCPALWVAQKIFGFKGQPSAAMSRGIAVEDAVVDVIRNGREVGDAVQKALKRFDGTFFIGDEKTAKERAMVAPMVERVLEIVSDLGEPEFPENGQNRVELVCNGGEFKIPFIGYLDLLYPQHGKVIDIKTTQRMPSRMSAEHILQRCVYARAMGNHTVEFLYATPARAGLLADGDVAETLKRVKFHVARLERFLRLDAEQLRAVVPVNDSSFYWSGSEKALEMFEITAASTA